MIGSLFIVESTRQEAENFVRNDPFFQCGVWKQVFSVSPYLSFFF